MNMEHARGLVAQCWCDKRTKHTEMDPVLAEVFAERLMALVNAAEALYSAGRWALPRHILNTPGQAKHWEDLRAALGLESGQSNQTGGSFEVGERAYQHPEAWRMLELPHLDESLGTRAAKVGCSLGDEKGSSLLKMVKRVTSRLS